METLTHCTLALYVLSALPAVELALSRDPLEVAVGAAWAGLWLVVGAGWLHHWGKQ